MILTEAQMINIGVIRPGQDAQNEYHRDALGRFNDKRAAAMFRFRMIHDR